MWRRRISVAALALAALAALGSPAEAQQRRGPGGPPSLDDRMARLTEELSLTEGQAVGVREILEEMQERRSEMFSGGPPDDREAMRRMMEELRQETDRRLAEVLDEAQLGKYREIVARGRRGPPPPRRGPPAA